MCGHSKCLKHTKFLTKKPLTSLFSVPTVLPTGWKFGRITQKTRWEFFRTVHDICFVSLFRVFSMNFEFLSKTLTTILFTWNTIKLSRILKVAETFSRGQFFFKIGEEGVVGILVGAGNSNPDHKCWVPSPRIESWPWSAFFPAQREGDRIGNSAASYCQLQLFC